MNGTLCPVGTLIAAAGIALAQTQNPNILSAARGKLRAAVRCGGFSGDSGIGMRLENGARVRLREDAMAMIGQGAACPPQMHLPLTLGEVAERSEDGEGVDLVVLVGAIAVGCGYGAYWFG